MLLPLPKWFWDVYAADRMLQSITAQYGPIKYMKELKYMRLLHDGGVSNNYYKSDLTLAKVLKNDISIIEKNFSSSPKPASFKAEYYFDRAVFYFGQAVIN